MPFKSAKGGCLHGDSFEAVPKFRTSKLKNQYLGQLRSITVIYLNSVVVNFTKTKKYCQ